MWGDPLDLQLQSYHLNVEWTSTQLNLSVRFMDPSPPSPFSENSRDPGVLSLKNEKRDPRSTTYGLLDLFLMFFFPWRLTLKFVNVSLYFRGPVLSSFFN